MATKLVPDEDGWMKVLGKGQVRANKTTLILRPQEGFTLADFRRAALTIAICKAANPLPSEANATYITIHQHQNIAVIKTLPKTAAAKITRTSSIYIANQARKTNLMANLCAPGTNIINARIMGRSETAIITFRGTYIPPYFVFYMAKNRSKPQKPKAQYCDTCYWKGHRADVCPQAGSHKCKKCCKLLDVPDQQHKCHMNCVNSHGEHPPDYKDCPARREADAQTTKAAYLNRIKLRKNQQEQLTQKKVQVQDPKTHEQQPKSQPLQRTMRAESVGRTNETRGQKGATAATQLQERDGLGASAQDVETQR
ncbi:hypothetical protein HPB48_001655 [Haemaphysalis longicornis]|uniref:Uncharacterized protein n=1 Tax=Haemaphysalis longicornis TaxID=44386 RepID=A0A9J6GVW0_HAELO|nr:hypothetical protein HPB48_001655 [Haemaphysalis longicornis]